MIIYRMIMLSLLLVIISGCISVAPNMGAGEKITIDKVIADPGIHNGKEVLWGGKIIKTVNKKQGTHIEVLQLPLNTSDKPKDVDTSEGRFICWSKEYLDMAIYRPGRKITVFGEIQGVENAPLGEIEYTYPLIKATNIHLWKLDPSAIKVYHEYPPLFYRYPLLWGYPYYW